MSLTKWIQGTFLYFIFAAGLNYSSILGNNQTFLAWLDKWLKPVTNQLSYWNHCYQATVNGWSSSTFHSNCDGKGPSVTIIRVGKYIFGGYTRQSWGSVPSSKWPELFYLNTGDPSKNWAVSQRWSYCVMAVYDLLSVPCVYLTPRNLGWKKSCNKSQLGVCVKLFQRIYFPVLNAKT